MEAAGRLCKCGVQGRVPGRPQGERHVGANIRRVDSIKAVGLDKITQGLSIAQEKGQDPGRRSHQPVSLGASYAEAPV